MRVLVTGARGQLGVALGPALRGHDVDAADHAELDIADLAAVRARVAAFRPELVINAAAYNDVNDAESDPEGAFRANALGPRNLALATAEREIPLVHLSTDFVFDGRSERAYCELDRPNPISVYGSSKLAGEEAVRGANRRHFIARTAWLYSATGSNFALTMLSFAGRTEVRVVDDQFGSPTYAPHLARAIVQLANTRAFGTYHLAGRGGTSRCQFIRALYCALGVTTPVRPASSDEFPLPAARPRNAVLTTAQSPQVILPPWQEGVREFAVEAGGASSAGAAG